MDERNLSAMPSTSHSAQDAALGYLYQAKMALLQLLAESEGAGDAAISIELHDDVAWEEAGTPTELLQMKHHVSRARDLTDTSDDLWRTIGVWLDAGPSDGEGPILTLITTAAAAHETAAAALRPATRDVDRALQLLEAAAVGSRAESTRAIREHFMQLRPADRSRFVSRVRVLDQSPQISDVDELVRHQLRWAVPIGRQRPFMQRLWGWWFERVVEMLRREVRSVSVLSLGIFIDDLRSEFTQDNLPTFDDLGLPTQQIPDYEDRPFVHQLRWVAAPETQLRRAVLDYYRAYAHTARWLEEDLIGIEELQRFEARVQQEWETSFAWALNDLPASATEEQKLAAGQKLLRAALDQPELRLRDRYSDPFFARGKHHELADAGSIGWHPEFRGKLQELLLTRSA
jgi:hypothetical protein